MCLQNMIDRQMKTAAAARCIASLFLLIMAGCGAGNSGVTTGRDASMGIPLQGKVFGGRQPIVGSAVQLYAASRSGYGGSAIPMLTVPVKTDSSGRFSITGDYSCSTLDSPATPVYIVASGGDSGSGENSSIALMAALGACSNLTAATMVNINELTTVAAAYALAGFMSGPSQLGTSAGNAVGLDVAFNSVSKLVNNGTGSAPGPNLSSSAIFPLSKLNTLADVLAACINSSDGSALCSRFFTDSASMDGSTPNNTLTAILNIAKNPSRNVSDLFGLLTSSSPYQPTLSNSPSDFAIAVRYLSQTGSLSGPSAAALDSQGNLWVANKTNGKIAVFDATTAQASVQSGPTLQAPAGIAIDATGNAWVTDSGKSQLYVFAPGMAGVATNASGLSAPTGVAIDSTGAVWVLNTGGGSVTKNSVADRAVTSSVTYSFGASVPVALAINSK